MNKRTGIKVKDSGAGREKKGGTREEIEGVVEDESSGGMTSTDENFFFLFSQPLFPLAQSAIDRRPA